MKPMATSMAMSFRVTASMLLMMCLASAGFAEQTYTLQLHVRAGEKWAFDVSSSIKQTGQITANGQPAQQIDQSATQRRKGVIEFLSVENDRPTAIRISYDPDSSNSGTMAGQPVPAFSLAGKTVTLRQSNGQITNDLAQQPDESTLAELNRMMEPDLSIYPTHPVAVDEEWDARTDSLTKQFQLGPDDKVSMKCKLLAVKDADGRQVADVSVTGQVVKHDQGFIVTTTTLGGVSRVDLASGQTLNSDILGKMSSRGSTQVNGPNGQPANINVTADGTLEIHQIVKPAGQAGGDVAVAEAHATAPPMHDNPLAPHPATPVFAGNYKGEELSLDLTGDPSNYTGTMMLHDQKFPVTAHADAGKLVGTFQSGGDSFNFTATLNENTLTLASGGTTYTLKKATPVVNPLAAPKPKNPLAQ